MLKLISFIVAIVRCQAGKHIFAWIQQGNIYFKVKMLLHIQLLSNGHTFETFS